MLAELRRDGALSDDPRRRLAAAAFAHTAAYDAAIANWFDSRRRRRPAGHMHLALERAQSLRYGENPHQRGARYRETGATSWWDGVVQHGGKELSYLNLYDADAAWRLVHELADLGRAAAVVVKHANPCGAAVADDLSPPTSGPSNATPCRPSAASWRCHRAGHARPSPHDMVANAQADVIIAPAYDPAALELFAAKRKNMRVLAAPLPDTAQWHLRQISGGWLVQDP